MYGHFDFEGAFWAAWDRLFLALPRERQIEVMLYVRGYKLNGCDVGDYDWKQLAEAAALEAEANNSICI